MKKLITAVFVVSLSAAPLVGTPAHAGVVCGVVETVANKYLGPIHGQYGPIEDGLGEVCAITP